MKSSIAVLVLVALSSASLQVSAQGFVGKYDLTARAFLKMRGFTIMES